LTLPVSVSSAVKSGNLTTGALVGYAPMTEGAPEYYVFTLRSETLVPGELFGAAESLIIF
jgi:hypothetical protein